MTTTITNYDGGIATTPQHVVTPKNVEELRCVLRDVDRYPGPVRPMGSFHSLTPCPGVHRHRRAYGATQPGPPNRYRRHDSDGRGRLANGSTGCGPREQGLQLLLNIEIGNATLGSLACSHSKDAMDGVDHGQVSSYVTRIRWVDPAGELREASEATDPDLLYLVRSSNGLGGVCYEITIRIKPLEMIKFGYEVYPSRKLTQEHINTVARTNQAMVCWTIGHTTVVQTRNRTDRLERAWLAQVRRMAWTRVGAFIGRNIRRRTPPGLVRNVVESGWLEGQKLTFRVLSAIGGFSLYGPDKIMNYRYTPPSARYAFTFWAFPFDRWVEDLNAYLDFSDDHFKRFGFRCNMPLGSYFIKRDASSILSYTHDGDILSLDPIHAYRAEDEGEWHRFLREFNAWAYARGGIPLLNQSPFVERSQTLAAFGARWQSFSDWVAQVDPQQRMQNEFFAGLLGAG